MRRLRLLLMPAAMLGAPGLAPPPAGAPTTVLEGQDWLGLWRGGHVVAQRALAGWTLGAARVRGGAIEVAAERADAAETTDTILRFDAATLAPLGRGRDRALAEAPVRVPVGLDTGLPDDAARLPRSLAGRLPPPPRRVVVAPDASVAAVLRVQNAAKAASAPVLDAASGRPLPGTRVTIDDGTARENGAAQAVACLLPRGEGVIYTLLGAPADRVSTFRRFPAGRAAAVELKTPYVMSCLSAGS